MCKKGRGQKETGEMMKWWHRSGRADTQERRGRLPEEGLGVEVPQQRVAHALELPPLHVLLPPVSVSSRAVHTAINYPTIINQRSSIPSPFPAPTHRPHNPTHPGPNTSSTRFTSRRSSRSIWRAHSTFPATGGRSRSCAVTAASLASYRPVNFSCCG